ncbi:MAG: hypothetical protein J5659_01235 [Clostridia bacterium]|nr:hypothetical protein [Clostridia bacterium]
MIDIHSHILPGIDDGAKDLKDTEELLKQMENQGVTTAVATPHFYPGSAVFDDFLESRAAAMSKVCDLCGGAKKIKILPGAEVLYFSGIGNSEDICKLTLAGSNYLLLELMGLKAIDYRVINDIYNLKANFGIITIIAHIERYYKYKGYKELLTLVQSGDAVSQINASHIFSSREKRAVKKLIKSGMAHFVASDCHNPVNRPVELDHAYNEIKTLSNEQYLKIVNDNESMERELLAAYEKQNG